jgi:hypothetical protein
VHLALVGVASSADRCDDHDYLSPGFMIKVTSRSLLMENAEYSPFLTFQGTHDKIEIGFSAGAAITILPSLSSTKHQPFSQS